MRQIKEEQKMRVGFIGCGNMATAMIKGMTASGLVKNEEMTASAKSQGTRDRMKSELNIHAAETNSEVLERSDIVFLAVKPIFYEEVLAEIRDYVRPEHIFVSLAPGKTLDWLGERLGETAKIVRTMPNTPAMVGEGMTGLCVNQNVAEEETKMICGLCDTFGKTEVVPERLIDVVVGVSGSSPAYVFMFLEAMADAAVADGMPRAQAYQFAAQAVKGSAELMLQTGKHPGELKDMVCSPGGTTIEAVRVLEEKGLRSAVIEAQKACVRAAKGEPDDRRK